MSATYSLRLLRNGAHAQFGAVLQQAGGLALKLAQQLTADIATTQQDHIDVGGMAEKRGMAGARGRLRILAPDHHCDGALGGALGNDFHVHAGRGNGHEETAGNTAVMLHAFADQRYDRTPALHHDLTDQAVQPFKMKLFFQRLAGIFGIRLAHAQGDAVFRGRLHDQQDGNRLAGQGIHDPARDANAAS